MVVDHEVPEGDHIVEDAQAANCGHIVIDQVANGGHYVVADECSSVRDERARTSS